MNVIDAAHATVHDYPGGSVALAPRINMVPAVLRGKVNCNDDRHHLTLAEAQRIQTLTGDHRMLMAMADELGYLCLPLPDATDGSLQLETLRAMSSFGELSDEIGRAIADGRVTINEMRRIESAMLAVVGHIAALHRAVAGVGK